MISDDKYFDEILKCIDNLDYDENVKNLFIDALNFELKHNTPRFSNEYKKLFNRYSGDE